MKTFSLSYVNALLDLEYKMQEEDDEEAKEWFQQYFAALLADIYRAEASALIAFVKDELGFLGAPTVFVMELLQDHRPQVYQTLETMMDQDQIEQHEE